MAVGVLTGYVSGGVTAVKVGEVLWWGLVKRCLGVEM